MNFRVLRAVIGLFMSISILFAQETYATRLWSNSYGTNLQERTVSMERLASGDMILVARQSTMTTPDGNDVFLAIIDTLGNLLDSASINFGEREWVVTVLPHADNSFSIIGHKDSHNLWTARIDESLQVRYSVILDYDLSWADYGAYNLNDSTWVFTTSCDSSLCLLGINPSGEVISEVVYPHQEEVSEMWGVGIEPYGTGYVIGANTGFWHGDYGEYRPTLIYVDSTFAYQNSVYYISDEISNALVDFTVSNSGYIYLLYNTWGYQQGLWDDSYIICISPAGDSLWTKVYGGSNDDISYEIETCGDDNLLVVGTSRSFNSYDTYDLWAYKIDSDGEILWEYAESDGVFGSIQSCYEMDATNFLLFHSEGTDYQVYVSLLQERVVSTEPFDQKINSFRIKSLYPNPTNPTTTVEFSVPHLSNVSMSVYAINGKEIWSKQYDNVRAGNHKIQLGHQLWDRGNLATGVYFVRLQAGEVLDSRKILLLK